jgi:signal transduction histidine kinase
MAFPMDHSVSGHVMRANRAEVLADAAADERIHQPFVRTGEIGPAMFFPLSVQGRTFGTVAVGNHVGGREFTVSDLALVETFAGQASLAMEYARTREELTRLSIMEDRERIAKELHDGVIQSLFAVGMGLQATVQISGVDAVEQRIESAVAEVDRVIRDLRNYIFGLQPGILADRQLDQALRQLVSEFQERSGVITVVEIDGRVAAELASRAGDVVQFVREALSNVERHAKAETCRVSLQRRDDAAELLVDDDGLGFDLDAEFGTGNGLPNLKERAAALGGDVRIESEPRSGTAVRLTMPL